jgi:hypothetical protein
LNGRHGRSPNVDFTASSRAPEATSSRAAAMSG